MTDKQIRIGVTGSAGSGKSLVCQCLGQLGLVTLDCDRIARELVAPGREGYARVVDLFGDGVVREDNTLDRARLRQMVIKDPNLRKSLEAMLHPLILSEMARQMAHAVYEKEPACAVEVPLLFELGMETRFDVTLVVVAREAALFDRLVERDQVSRNSAGKLLDLQMPQSEKIKRADHVIHNLGAREELFESVENCYRKIKKDFLTRKG